MPYVKYAGMRFSNAVVLLGFLPAAVTAGEEPEEDFFKDFMLTKEALKHHFEAAVLMRHPEKNTEHEQGPHFVRQAYLMVLEAHKYLHFCVRSGNTTNQQAQRNERQNTAWKQETNGNGRGTLSGDGYFDDPPGPTPLGYQRTALLSEGPYLWL